MIAVQTGGLILAAVLVLSGCGGGGATDGRDRAAPQPSGMPTTVSLLESHSPRGRELPLADAIAAASRWIGFPIRAPGSPIPGLRPLRITLSGGVAPPGIPVPPNRLVVIDYAANGAEEKEGIPISVWIHDAAVNRSAGTPVMAGGLQGQKDVEGRTAVIVSYSFEIGTGGVPSHAVSVVVRGSVALTDQQAAEMALASQP